MTRIQYDLHAVIIYNISLIINLKCKLLNANTELCFLE